MKLKEYNEIIAIIHASWQRECVEKIKEAYPGLTQDTVISIYSQEFQKKIKKTHHKHQQPEVKDFYYNCYTKAVEREPTDSMVLVKIANENDVPPCALARIVLEKYLSNSHCSGDIVPKDVINHMIKDTSLIPDKILENNVHQCVLNDENTGPMVDNIKHSVGLQYENMLEQKLAEMNIPFLGEDDMRCQGYDKTPDFKLQVPISVDGHVVNWIESKASFGDETSHRAYLKDQFWSYWNRFGPGMVIYWFGFIDELNCNQDKGIILKDHFPQHLTTLTSLVCKDIKHAMDQATEKFDLLKGKEENDIFRVSFDFFKPRPHFILLEKCLNSLPQDFSLLETQHVNELFLACTATLYHYNINFAVLSLHRGSWVSQSHEFLAHLCVNLKDYLRVFEEMKGHIPDWPSEVYVTRKWIRQDPESYVSNASQYPARSYHAEEVVEIQKCNGEDIIEDDTAIVKEYHGVRVVYHASHPKIGFLKKEGVSARKMLEILESFASEHELTSGTSGASDHSGCHLCFYFGIDDAEQEAWTSGAHVDIAGYIVTTGKRFYQLCPVDHRQAWFQAFRASRFNCVT